jgi:hypothetical protein
MAGGYSYLTKIEYKNRYRNDIEDAIYKVNKNFCQMDFENAATRDKIQIYVESIISRYKGLLAELDEIK